jgi:hypothetical protein
MTRSTLVLVHGRSQGGKDPAELKRVWLDTLRKGLGVEREGILNDIDVQFPYYGDVLDEFIAQAEEQLPADIIVRGQATEADPKYLAFQAAFIEEARSQVGLVDAQIGMELDGEVRTRGPENWEWVQAILRAMDAVPGVSARALERFTRDVYLYLSRSVVRKRINDIVLSDISTTKTVVIGHSLGSVVAYDVLKDLGGSFDIPLYATVGSPLGVRPIRNALGTLSFPTVVKSWYNAFDERDVVALNPLDTSRFPVDPPIENYAKVRNGTENAHGIIGYLNDAVVAKRIYDALV